jgi:hypothetical protein
MQRNGGGGVKFFVASSSKDRILEETISIIEARGETSVKVHEIAERCALSTTMIYHHFGSRKGLVLAAQAERYRRTMQGFEEPLARRVMQLSSREEFSQFVSELWMKFLRDPRYQRQRRTRTFLIGASEGQPEARSSYLAQSFSQIENVTAVLEFALERGWIRPEILPRGMAELLLTMLNGRVILEFEETPNIRDDLDAMSLATVLWALFPDE